MNCWPIFHQLFIYYLDPHLPIIFVYFIIFPIYIVIIYNIYGNESVMWGDTNINESMMPNHYCLLFSQCDHFSCFGIKCSSVYVYFYNVIALYIPLEAIRSSGNYDDIISCTTTRVSQPTCGLGYLLWVDSMYSLVFFLPTPHFQ